MLPAQAHTAKMAGPKRLSAVKGPIGIKVAGVGKIEVKAVIADHQIDGALERYGLEIDRRQERYIYFFDTPQRALLEEGVILRARRTVGGEHDSTVKYRPFDPADVPRSLKGVDGFKLEADASEKGVERSASFTVGVERGLIRSVVAGNEAISALFSRQQRSFVRASSGRDIDLDALRIFGPLRAFRWRNKRDPACPWPMTAELWIREDGARLMEVSVRAKAAQAAVAIGGFMALLDEVGAKRDMKQKSKTRWALELGPS